MKFDTILVLDFGGQYCHLIGRRVREHKVYSEIVPFDVTPDQIKALNKKFNVKGIILSGGPSSIYEQNAPKCTVSIFNLNIPVLGLCYGHQLIAHLSGGKVESARKKEYGIAYVTIDKPIDVLKGLKQREKVWMSHGDTVYDIPKENVRPSHTQKIVQ